MSHPPGYVNSPVSAIAPLPPGNHINPAPIAENSTSKVSAYLYPSVVLGETTECMLKKIHVEAEVHVSVAFVKLYATFVNHTKSDGDCMLFIPMNQYATVVSAQITIGSRIIETQVISQEDAVKYSKKTPQSEASKNNYESYSPEVFRLPIRNIQPGDTLYVTANYYETLHYMGGKYSCTIPMKIPSNVISEHLNMTEVLSFDITLTSVVSGTKLTVENHPIKVISEENGKISVQGNKDEYFGNNDIVFSYPAYSTDITATVLVSRPDSKEDPRNPLLIFVSPPKWPKAIGTHGRSVVFLLDRSGSMTGDPMEQAKKALHFGLGQLHPQDFFSIIAFDDQQDHFSTTLMPATPTNIDSAKVWTTNIKARGLTDIMTPLSSALKMLEGTAPNIPFVFLITDGAVTDERSICKYVSGCRTSTRICTFGIGTYCNAYFLKMLSTLGRGFCDVGLNPDKICAQIIRMLEMAQAPALTDIELGLRVVGCEIYPYPVPDLFIGAPLVVSGKFVGGPLNNVLIKGNLPGGNVWSETIKTSASHDIPISKVFTKQYLDLMTSKTWLSSDDKLRQQVIDYSIRESMPCAYTTMVAYETTAEKKNSMNEQGKTDSGKMNKGAIAAGLAIGGFFIIGAAPMHFGNLAASLGNMSVLGGLTDLNFGSLGDGIAGAGGTVLNGLGDAGSVILEGLQNLGGGIGSFGDALGGAFQESASLCGDVCGSMCGECGSVCGECCGNCLEICGDIIGAIIEGGLAA